MIFCLFFLPHLLKAQQSNTIYSTGDTSKIFDNYFFDNFGNKYSFDEIRISNSSPTLFISENTCIAGYFHLYFSDTDVQGFNDPAEGASRRAVACSVFTDISKLIVPAINPLTGADPAVNIIVLPSTNLETTTLGAASSFYIKDALLSGFMDGEIWKTLNGGMDSYTNLNLIGYSDEDFYHGTLQINFINFSDWWTDLKTVAPPDRHDLYTVILHEAMHALGFTSFITGDGSSGLAGNIYSRFDSYLFTNSFAPLITINGSCNNTTFSTGTVIDSSCYILYNGSTTQPIYSPVSFLKGSSFNHFDYTCPLGTSNNIPYLMVNALGTGITRRRPLQQEVQVLCDLGYQTTNVYGADQTLTTIYKNDYTPCGNRIAGVNDFYISGTTTRYSVLRGNTITIDDFLLNDNDNGNAPTRFNCLEIVSGSGTISSQGNSSFNFQSNATYAGLVTLRYRPLNALGQTGNITYIFINVTADQLPVCTSPFPCNTNIVCYGGFEEFTDEAEMDMTLTFGIESTKDAPFYFDEIFENSPYFSGNNEATSSTCNNGSVDLAPHSGNNYIGLIVRGYNNKNYPEGIALSFNRPVLPGATGIISFFARKGHQQCTAEFIQSRFTNIQPCPGKILNECPGLVSSQIFPNNNGQEILTDSYQLYTIPFTNNTANNWNYLLLNSLTLVDTDPANGSIWLDDISVIIDPLPQQNAGLDQSICNGGTANIGSPSVSNTIYNWLPTVGVSNSTISNPTANPSITTTYTVTATDQNGCTGSDDVTITVLPSSLSILPSGPTSFCPGGSVVLTSSLIAGSYLWSTGSTSNAITAILSGTYSLTVTDGACTNSSSITIIVDTTEVFVDAGENDTVFIGYTPLKCAILTATVSGTVLPYNFLWSTGDTTQSITVCPSETTTYSVIADADGCKSEPDFVTVVSIDVRCGKNSDKVLVCHVPPGNSSNAHEICISPSSVPAHLTHEDRLGSCVSPLDKWKRYSSDDNFTIEFIKTDGTSKNIFESYPNPFSNFTTVTLRLQQDEITTISVSDIFGKKVALLFDGLAQQDKNYFLHFDASNLPGGVYFIRLISEYSTHSQKLVLIK
ncbi:MAG: hypothetical protein A3H98_06680 [Bacteroidetes bacterium RIFCSPLOWO2_02_FULL_36_8]|nr:MAG: hypothetical protein A3H98_06680 [Bacteroidetes bacterium RIFCSPLOWO2_02_FULL_36_8]